MCAKSTPESFWSQVDIRSIHECWNWLGACSSKGYGFARCYPNVGVAHRISGYLLGILDTISAPQNKRGTGFALHSCDNKKCCNPTHIISGTQSRNLKDAYRRNLRSRLSDLQVIAIRELYSTGMRQVDIANQFKIDQSTVSLIVRQIIHSEV